MKTSLSEIKQIDDHIGGGLTGGDRLLFDAKMVIDPVLRVNVTMQKKLYALVKFYGRRKIKRETVMVQDRIFNNDSFRNEILTIFSNP